jgi:hypothetical protein
MGDLAKIKLTDKWAGKTPASAKAKEVHYISILAYVHQICFCPDALVLCLKIIANL